MPSNALRLVWGGALLALLAALAWAAWALELPPWLFGAAFLAVAVFYANTVAERVPLYLTNATTRAAVSTLLDGEPQTLHAEKNRPPAFVDLGCGMGGVVIDLARRHPDWNVVGVETAPGPYLIAKLRALAVRNAQIRFQSLWQVDLRHFDVAYAFLSPVPMARLLAKAEAEMPTGALFVSNSFWADGVPYDGVAVVNDRRTTQLIFKRF